MGALLQFSYQFQSLICYKCGICFAVSDDFYTRRKNDGEIFYCPSGHGQGFVESENSRLKKQLEQERGRKERAMEESNRLRQDNASLERSRNAIKGQVTKVKNRISKGVCPCCNRSFTNLRRHMEYKHPDYSGKIDG